MIQHRSYVFKKTYLDQDIFEKESEIKVGYLNINGLQDGNHIHYFNEDKNLNYLDLIVLSETKLGKQIETKILENSLSNWLILGRYDAQDEKKHMGLNKNSSFNGKMIITHQTAKRGGSLQIEGVIVKMRCGLNLGFIYCRSSPLNLKSKQLISTLKNAMYLWETLN